MKSVPMGVHATRELISSEAPGSHSSVSGGVMRSRGALRVGEAMFRKAVGHPKEVPSIVRIPLHSGKESWRTNWQPSCPSAVRLLRTASCVPRMRPQLCAQLPSFSHGPELSFCPGLFPSRLHMLHGGGGGSFKT